MLQKTKIARMAGYTIDQTILIVAVIAILITLVIASVGWDILTRAGGAKLASNLRQLEDSTGLFYSDAGGVWPQAAEDLVTGTTTIASVTYGVGKNYVPGFAVSSGGSTLDHDFGPGGTITMVDSTNSAADTPCPGASGALFKRFTLTNIPETEALNADKSVDGEDGNAAGRLYWTTGPTNVTINYCANQQS